MLETVEKSCTLVTVNNIPHFCLAIFAFNSHCIIVVRVYLYRKIVLGVNELNKDREVLKSFAVLAKNALACLFDILIECQTLVFAVSNNAWTVFMTRKLPALCDLIIIALFAVLISKSGAAPDVVLKCWIKFKY